MKQNEFLAFHQQSFQEYLAYWRDPGHREAAEMSVGEAAYHLLAHAGLAARCISDEKLCDELAAFPGVDRDRLIFEACDFGRLLALPERLRELLKVDTLDSEDLEEFEQILLQRDELDVVIELAKQLNIVRIEEDDVLLKSVTSAINVAMELDDQLLARPDIISVCSRILVGIRPAGWLKGGSYPDWFDIARKWDDEFSSPLQFAPNVAGKLGTARLPRAIALLVASTQKNYSLAASDDLPFCPPAFALSVQGDETIRVRLLPLTPLGSSGDQEMRVELVGTVAELKRYKSVEISLPNVEPRTAALELGFGSLLIREPELADLDALLATPRRVHRDEPPVAITLIDFLGNRRSVDLEWTHDDQ